MRIYSTDKKVYVKLSRDGGDTHSPFSVESSVDISHGRFGAINSDIHFLNHDEFLKEFDAFILNREIVPRLKGTYDTEIRFFQPKDKNIVMVSFAIGDAFSGYTTTVRFKSEGQFEVDAEYLNELLSNFEKLFKDT